MPFLTLEPISIEVPWGSLLLAIGSAAAVSLVGVTFLVRAIRGIDPNAEVRDNGSP